MGLIEGKKKIDKKNDALKMNSNTNDFFFDFYLFRVEFDIILNRILSISGSMY